jgi:MFS family permease
MISAALPDKKGGVLNQVEENSRACEGDHRFAQRSLSASLSIPLIIAIASAGAALVFIAYWPGIMIDDARWQYQQVVDNAYEDWHPPLMAWIWRQLTGIATGPGPMLVLQVLLYWIGFALIATSALKRGARGVALALVLLGFLPATLALSGTVTKDALMDGILLAASGMILWRPLVQASGARIALSLGAMALLFVAAALRFNAFFACVPLALAALPRRLPSNVPLFFLSTIIAAAAFVMTGPAISALLQAEKTDVELSLIIFDLGGITEHSGVSQFPDMHVQNPVAVNHRCYDPYGWDSYSSWAKKVCPLGFDPLQALIDDDDFDARSWWVGSIVSQPIAYLQHRFTHFNLSSWFLVSSGPAFTSWSQSVPNPWGFRVVNNALLTRITRLTNDAATTPIGWPIFWISMSLAALVAGLMARAPGEKIAIAASAFFYGAGYLIVGVATGIRYYVWTFDGAAIAALLIGYELWLRRSHLQRRAIVVPAGIAIVPTLMAIAARIAT